MRALFLLAPRPPVLRAHLISSPTHPISFHPISSHLIPPHLISNAQAAHPHTPACLNARAAETAETSATAATRRQNATMDYTRVERRTPATRVRLSPLGPADHVALLDRVALLSLGCGLLRLRRHARRLGRRARFVRLLFRGGLRVRRWRRLVLGRGVTLLSNRLESPVGRLTAERPVLHQAIGMSPVNGRSQHLGQ